MPTVTPTLLGELVRNLGTIASVYHKPASTFLAGRYVAETAKVKEEGYVVDV